MSVRCSGEAPFAYARLPPIDDEDLRRNVFRPYLVAFRVRESEVEIVRILHGARDLNRILDTDAP